MSDYNPGMTHVGLENDRVSPEVLLLLSHARHHGWSWKGSEVHPNCLCSVAVCGLVDSINTACSVHSGLQFGTAKQVHWRRDCPGQ